MDFDCTLILHVEAIKQKAGEAPLSVRPGVVSYHEDTRKRGI